MLATGDKTGIKIFITLLTTAIFYASYHSVFISQGNYQHGFDYKIIVLLFIPVTYNFYFAVKRIIRIADKFQIFSADPAKHL
jgi:hypothetical protein